MFLSKLLLQWSIEEVECTETQRSFQKEVLFIWQYLWIAA